MSLLQIVVFLIEHRPYGLPLEAVERVLPMVDISPLPCAPPVLLGVVDYHGEILPVMDLRVRLGLPSRDEPVLTERLLVVTTPRRRLAIATDEVAGIRAVEPAQMHSPAGLPLGLPQVAGIAVLDEGLVVIQDLETLLSAEEDRELQHALRETRS